MVKLGAMPTCAASRRKMRAQMAWNVPTVKPCKFSPSNRSMRSSISRAALLVKVTAMIWLGGTFS
jgi:hypothetical protein